MSGKRIKLDFINNYEPFSKASFIMKENNNIQVPLSSIGSGYEMIFSLLYSYYLAKQNDKNIIIIIDEPELHLHPDVQKKFVEFLLKISTDSQISLSSHSPNLVKLLTDDSKLKIMHFARFDMAILEKSFNIEINNVYCTKIASKIARTYTDTHGLKVLIREVFGIDVSKREQCSYWGGKINEEQLKYAANDVLYLHGIKKYLDNILIREGRMEYAQ